MASLPDLGFLVDIVSVIASEAKQSSFVELYAPLDCFASLAMTATVRLPILIQAVARLILQKAARY
jgi:hypothetical protein